MAEFVAVANVADVPPGTATVVRGEGIEVALVNVDGSLYAVDNGHGRRLGRQGFGRLRPDDARAARRPSTGSWA